MSSTLPACVRAKAAVPVAARKCSWLWRLPWTIWRVESLKSRTVRLSDVNKRRTAIYVLAFLATSCSINTVHVRARPLPKPNPTYYSFPLPLDELRAKSLEAFDLPRQMARPIFGSAFIRMVFSDTFCVETATNAAFGTAIFQNPANVNDIYLHTFNQPFEISPVYYAREGGLPFFGAFHLHLTSVGSNTLVTVTALETKVASGSTSGCSAVAIAPTLMYKKVEPTTVEEYTILKYLGDYLGQTNMPDVIRPTL